MTFDIWGSKSAGKKVILHTDNHVLVSILNYKTSKIKRVMHLLKKLVLQGLVFDIFSLKRYISWVCLTLKLNVSLGSSGPVSGRAEGQSSLISYELLQAISNLDLKSS